MHFHFFDKIIPESPDIQFEINLSTYIIYVSISVNTKFNTVNPCTINTLHPGDYTVF